MRKLNANDIGQTLGVSEWITISQEEVNVFGKVTRDIDPYHTEPAWAAANSPFRTTIVYGFQTLAMLTYFLHEIMEWPPVSQDAPGEMALNYGFERVRFLEPVPVGARIRCHVKLLDLEERNAAEILRTFLCTVEIEGVEKPALVAEWKGLMLDDPANSRLERDLSVK